MKKSLTASYASFVAPSLTSTCEAPGNGPAVASGGQVDALRGPVGALRHLEVVVGSDRFCYLNPPKKRGRKAQKIKFN